MSDARESWKEIGSKMEALGLKLKLHLAQERSEGDESDDDSAFHKLSRAIDDVTDSLEHAVQDDAVKSDVREIFSALPPALTRTFQEIAGEVKGAIERHNAGAGEISETDEQPPA